MKKNKKKLPRYWLGTRMPINIGYQKANNNGINNVTTDPGIKIDDKSAHDNILPNSIKKLTVTAQNPLQMIQNFKTIPVTTQLGSSLANAAAANFGASTLKTGGSQIGSLSNTINNINKLGTNGVLKSGTSTVTKTGLTPLGTAAGVAGAISGIMNVVNDFSNSGPDLTSQDIMNTASKSQYTTEYGNTYTQYGGIDRNSVMSYADAEKKTKQIGSIIDTTGLGSTLGGLVGSLALSGSIGGPLGTALGAGLGFIAGGIGNLLGFGDNEEEYQKMIERGEDVIGMRNRQSESLAMDADTKAAFYNKQNKPIQAKDGKLPCYSDGVNARVSNGEGIAKYANGLIYDLKRVPGVKNNDDTVETHLDKNSIVFSNKYGISDEAMVDPYSALARQTMLQNMGILGKSKNAKNGKLPSFWGGTAGQYLNVAVPSIFGIAANLARLNQVNNSDRTVPKASIGDFGANDVINETYADQINPMEYIKHAHDQYRQQLWKIQRDPGFGYGARRINEANAYAQMQRQLADTRLKIDEANRTQRNSSRSMKFQDTLNRRAFDIDNFWKSDQRGAQINAAYEKYRSEIPRSIYNILGSVAGNIGQIGNYNDSLKFNEKRLGLLEQSVNNDTDKVNAIIKSMRYNNYTPVIQDNKEIDPVEWYNNLPWWQQNDYLRRSARAANLIISV